MKFTHLDSAGQARMVDVTDKQPTKRAATASATVVCDPEILKRIASGEMPKGDVLAVARIAGIAAAKRTPELLPLAHVIGVHGAAVDLTRRASRWSPRCAPPTAPASRWRPSPPPPSPRWR